MLNNLMENLQAMGANPAKIDGNTVKINAPIVNAEKSKKRVIWGNINLDIDDWRDGWREYCDINGLIADEYDDGTISDWIGETNAYYLDDEKINLDKKIDGKILVIADIGRWDGRKQGYKITTQNLNSILYHNDEYFEIYGDGKNIRATGYHHDGTNYYLYRAIRPGRDICKLLDAIYNGETISAAKLNYYTRSIYQDIANIYGW